MGIDFGTSKLCAAIYVDGQFHFVRDELDDGTMAAIVSFLCDDLGEMLVGNDAKDQTVLNPTNCIRGVKEVLGSSFADVLREREKAGKGSWRPSAFKIQRGNRERCEILLENAWGPTGGESFIQKK